MGTKLSIIIPYYKTYDLTMRLLDVLKPQLTSDIEVLVVNNSDDNSFDDNHIRTLYCKSNGTASKPRNVGLDNAKGEYIGFIDSDDMITDDYIEKILEKIEVGFDICYISFKLNDMDIIITDKPHKWDCNVWSKVYHRDIIGDVRFDESLSYAEDWFFNDKIKFEKEERIEKILYYYKDDRVGSLSWKKKK